MPRTLREARMLALDSDSFPVYIASMGSLWKPAASPLRTYRLLPSWITEALGRSDVAIDFHRELSLTRLLCTFWHMPDPALNKYKPLFQDAHFSHFQITFQLILLHAQWTEMLNAIFFVCFNGVQLQPLRGHNNSRITPVGIREKKEKEKEKRRRRRRKRRRRGRGRGRRREAFLNVLGMASYVTVVPVKMKSPGSGIKINNNIT